MLIEMQYTFIFIVDWFSVFTQYFLNKVCPCSDTMLYWVLCFGLLIQLTYLLHVFFWRGLYSDHIAVNSLLV